MATTTQKSRTKTTKSPSRARSGASTRARTASRQAASGNASRAAASSGTAESTASKLRAPAMASGAAIAAILGGVALGAKARSRKRHFPSVNGVGLKKVDMKKTVKQVGRASKQFGAFTKELRKAGEQAERIGNALS